VAFYVSRLPTVVASSHVFDGLPGGEQRVIAPCFQAVRCQTVWCRLVRPVPSGSGLAASARQLPVELPEIPAPEPRKLRRRQGHTSAQQSPAPTPCPPAPPHMSTRTVIAAFALKELSLLDCATPTPSSSSSLPQRPCFAQPYCRQLHRSLSSESFKSGGGRWSCFSWLGL
jgi:hypothetical protein